jgi:hypothetical protein
MYLLDCDPLMTATCPHASAELSRVEDCSFLIYVTVPDTSNALYLARGVFNMRRARLTMSLSPIDAGVTRQIPLSEQRS